MKYFNKFLALFFILAGLKFAVTIPGTAIDMFQQNEPLQGFINLVFWLIYILSVYAGVQLWRGQKPGSILGRYLLLFQTVSFNIDAVTYRFTSLFDFFLFYKTGSPFGFDGYIGGRFALRFPDSPAEIMFGINVVAIALLIMLSKQYLSEKKMARSG